MTDARANYICMILLLELIIV